MRSDATLVHGLHITKAHAEKLARRRANSRARWVPCPCDLCRFVRVQIDRVMLVELGTRRR